MSPQVFKYNTSLEKQKIFISGLPFSCTKEQLETICRSYGAIKDARLVTYRSGKPKVRCRVEWPTFVSPELRCDLVKLSLLMCKHFLSVALQGLAYVEFAKEADASQAVLKMDGMELEGSKISVAISNPPRRNVMDKPGSSRPSADMMPRQVFGS